VISFWSSLSTVSLGFCFSNYFSSSSSYKKPRLSISIKKLIIIPLWSPIERTSYLSQNVMSLTLLWKGTETIFLTEVASKFGTNSNPAGILVKLPREICCTSDGLVILLMLDLEFCLMISTRLYREPPGLRSLSVFSESIASLLERNLNLS
jgi:hypothetical protein